MADAPKLSENLEFAFALGEIRGQLKELIHNMVNRSAADQVKDQILAELRGVPSDVAEIKDSLTAINARVATLELQETRRDTERGLVKSFMTSPMVGWVVGVGGVIYVWFAERLT